MSTDPSEVTEPTRPLEVSVEELLRHGRPFPSHDEMIIEGLTDDEEAAFLEALQET